MVASMEYQTRLYRGPTPLSVRDNLYLFHAGLLQRWQSLYKQRETDQSLILEKPKGTVPQDVKPTGTVPRDVKPTGRVPRDVKPTGTVPRDVKPTGTVPRDVNTTGTVPQDVNPTGAVPRDYRGNAQLCKLLLWYVQYCLTS